MKRKSTHLLVTMLISALMCGASLAGPIWICAITGAVACQDDGSVGQPDLGGLARPTFLRVDLDAKQVTILAPMERRGEATRIETVQQADNIWLLMGVERGRAWSLVIFDAGYMTMSVTGDGEVWSVFGSAILEENLAAPDGAAAGAPSK